MFSVNNHLPQPYVCNFEQSQCGFNGSASMHGMEWARLNVALGHTFLDTDNTFHTKGQGKLEIQTVFIVISMLVALSVRPFVRPLSRDSNNVARGTIGNCSFTWMSFIP
jgi:hypothetical protein